jgi:hypothetical protein
MVSKAWVRAWVGSGLVGLLVAGCAEGPKEAEGSNNNAANNTANNSTANNSNNNNNNNNNSNNGDGNNNNNNNTDDNNDDNNQALPPYSCDLTPSGEYEAPNGDECDLIAQDCPDQEGCYLSDNKALCLPSTGAASCAAACEVGNDCGPGQVCAGEPRRCLALCELGRPCPAQAVCDPLQGRDDVGVCIQVAPASDCSAIVQNCPDDQGCYVVDGDEVCAEPLADAKGLDEPCEAANGCVPGLVCVGRSAAQLRCRQTCDPSREGSCDEGTCTLIEGTDGVGVCL